MTVTDAPDFAHSARKPSERLAIVKHIEKRLKAVIAFRGTDSTKPERRHLLGEGAELAEKVEKGNGGHIGRPQSLLMD
jgi:hypothetical protein